MPSVRLLWIFLLSGILLFSLVADGENSKDDGTAAQQEDSIDFGMVEWLHSIEGGYFNPKQVIRREDPEDPRSVVGIFATERIQKGELLLRVPWEAIVTVESGYKPIDEDLEEDTGLDCGTARSLAKEMKLGNQSRYAPYVSYLSRQRPGQLPSAWSEGGKALLRKLLGGTDEKPRIPPANALVWVEKDWYVNCNADKNDEFGTNVAMLVVQRADDDIMVPVYDLYNHRNGYYLNTKSHVEHGVRYDMRASRTIDAGEQIHNSYNLCTGCTNRYRGYGTPEIFSDYGFVERFPQRWPLTKPYGLEFDLVEDENNGIDGLPYALRWRKLRHPSRLTAEQRLEQVKYLQGEIKRLNQMRRKITRDLAIPDHEWELVWEYQEAVLRAFSMAVNELVDDENEKIIIWDPMIDYCSEQGASFCAGNHYGNFDHDLPSDHDTGKTPQFENYFLIDKIQSSYHEMTIAGRNLEEQEDICMVLGHKLQICSSYRPYYHEFFVHYAARFLAKVQRVLFVGGGDSMLLYEIIKYPSLEKVVGLELDLSVTQSSFQYFHTQPHFDDPRVEWWFGDATQSLRLLPQEYWGSFDLVLVDMPEAVMASAVSDDWNMFDVLALLLQPHGIMVKNEHYLDTMAETFEYSIQIYLESPKVYNQVFTLGSQRVDFLHRSLKDHDIETQVLPPLQQMEDPYEYIHDYRKSEPQCWANEEYRQEKNLSGILMLMNVEQVSLDWKRMPILLSEAAAEYGFHIATSTILNKTMAIVILQEGYIQMQNWPEQQFLAMEVYLWSKINLLNKLESSLSNIFGGEYLLSSFRVVVASMSGANEEDNEVSSVGPGSGSSGVCDATEELSKASSPTTRTMPPGLQTLLSAIQGSFLPDHESSSLRVGLVHGSTSESFNSTDKSQEMGMEVVVFDACANTLGIASSTKNGSSEVLAMYACEKVLTQQVSIALSSRLDVLVFDSTVPMELYQIWHSILSRHWNTTIFPDKHVVVTLGSTDEIWRWNFLDRYREEIRVDPTIHGQVTVGPEWQVGLVVRGEDDEIETLVGRLSKFESMLQQDVNARIETIVGGVPPLKKDWEHAEFTPQNYDQEPATWQQKSQEVLAHQMVAQFDIGFSQGKSIQITASNLSEVLQKTLQDIEWINDDNGDDEETAPSLVLVEGNDIDGDGVVFVSPSTEGCLIAIWGGGNVLALNLILRISKSNNNDKVVDHFLHRFSKHASRLGSRLQFRKDIPRGTGRTVTFPQQQQEAAISTFTV